MKTKQEARIQWLYREIRKNIIIKGNGNLNENDEEIQRWGELIIHEKLEIEEMRSICKYKVNKNKTRENEKVSEQR